MSDRSVRIVPLGEERGDEAAAILARAFHDEPLYVYACPDPAARARWLPWHFRWSVWAGYAFGVLVGTEGRLDGVAAAIGPGGGELTAELIARVGSERGREAVGAELWDRVNGMLPAVFAPADAALRRAAPEPHWRLDAIGVDPARRGMGIGGSLLHAVNARADADRLPVALITRQPRNLAFYTRHGYRVVCAGTEPMSGLRWWGLRRDAGG